MQCGVRSAKYKIRYVQSDDQGVEDLILTQHSELRTPNSGFTYIALLTAVVIMGILMASAGKYWQNVVKREKEEELLFRGDQYRRAIERYYNAKPGANKFPPNLDALLSDDRFPQARRHLRRLYKDPFTGEDFELITAQTATGLSAVPPQMRTMPGIIGVCSRSDKEPLKQAEFPEEYKDFEGKKSYSDWKFVSTAPQQVQAPGQLRPQVPGQFRPQNIPGGLH